MDNTEPSVTICMMLMNTYMYEVDLDLMRFHL